MAGENSLVVSWECWWRDEVVGLDLGQDALDALRKRNSSPGVGILERDPVGHLVSVLVFVFVLVSVVANSLLYGVDSLG